MSSARNYTWMMAWPKSKRAIVKLNSTRRLSPEFPRITRCHGMGPLEKAVQEQSREKIADR